MKNIILREIKTNQENTDRILTKNHHFNWKQEEKKKRNTGTIKA